MMIIKKCAYIITQNKNREIFENCDILIEKNIIKKIGKNLKVNNAKEIISGKNKIIMPGLVNTHTHIGMHSLRGICDDEELPKWLELVVKAEKKFSFEDIQHNAEHACKEMLRFGTTTFCEMYQPVEPIIEGVKKFQIRAVLCPVLYDFMGTINKQFIAAKKIIEKSELENSELLKIGLGFHSVYACSKEMLKKAKQYAQEKNLLTPIHIAETRKERFDVQDKHQKLPLEYLENLQVLDKNMLLVHGIWMTKGEVRMIGKHNAKVSHCPVSNMKLASGGTTPLMEMFEAGIKVGLGTDSVASNNNMDMFEEMKITGLLHKYHRWDPSIITNQKIIDLATIDGAACLNMEKEIGSLEEGKKADIIAINIGLHMKPINKQSVMSHIVYSANGNDIVDVIVDGKIVLRNKKELY